MRALAVTLVLLAAAASAQQTAPKAPQNAGNRRIIFWNMSRESVDFLLRRVPQPNPTRVAQLKQAFFDLQCWSPHLREQPLPEGQNLLCTLPGSAPELTSTPEGKYALNPSHGTILFLAHYEHEGPGQSAIDNWSGAIMLPFLFHALSATPRQHTFVFAEVDGEAGAKALFNSFTPSERLAIKGVVALDALGIGPAQFYLSSNDITAYNYPGWDFLHRQFLQTAVDQGIVAPVLAIPGNWQKVDETREFRHHGIPSILIHSVTWDGRHLPGSAQDTQLAIDHDLYFKTISLLAAYAVELDQPWPQAPDATLTTPSGRRH